MADLYIRWSKANPKDIGDRPLVPCWPPNAVWTNASIWMSYPMNHPDPAKQNQTAPKAKVGEQVWINVEIYTREASFPPFQNQSGQIPIRCQIWACTGANGTGPVSAVPSSGGNGLPALVTNPLSSPDTFGVARALWTPLASDNLKFDPQTTEAHLCLAANCFYEAQANATPQGQGTRMPATIQNQNVNIIYPCGDGPPDPRSNDPIGRFHGQKNIAVQSSTNLIGDTGDVEIWGAGEEEQVHVVEVQERRGQGVITRVLKEQLLAQPFVEHAGGNPRPQRMQEVTEELIEIMGTEYEEVLRAGPLPLEPAERATLAGGGRLVLAGDPTIALRVPRRPLEGLELQGPDGARGTKIEVPAHPDRPEVVHVDLSVTEKDRPGMTRVIDVTQHDQSGRVVGGTTIVTVGDV